MRRILPLLALLLVGCGGHHGSSVRNPVDPDPTTGLPPLGAASVDLAITNGTGSAFFPSLQGTGDTSGTVELKDEGGVAELNVVVARISVEKNEFQRQALTVRFAHSEPLAVGMKTTLDVGGNSAEYLETKSVLSGPIAGDGVSFMWTANTGTVEVTSVSEKGIGLRLTDLGLANHEQGRPFEISMSGTVSSG